MEGWGAGLGVGAPPAPFLSTTARVHRALACWRVDTVTWRLYL